MKNKIKPYIEEKLISEQKHPEVDLWIYNYTPKCQYEQKWDEITMMCRGLILNDNGNIIARPFKKFFNLGEYKEDLPAEHFTVYEKYDGSLGILYFVENKPQLATRGSFTSEQAIKGTEILLRKYEICKFNKEYTYLFEIIYPENRIVVDYGNEENLILLAVFETKTGRELPLEEFKQFEIAKRYDGMRVLDFNNMSEENREGYVIKFLSGLRLKVKFEEYVRLHRIITEINSKVIWKHLKDNLPFDEILDRVPDEFYNWVKKTTSDLNQNFKNIEDNAYRDFNKIKHLKERKDFAKEAIKSEYNGIIFNILDNRDYNEQIWRMIKPKAEKPFKDEI